MVEWVHIVVALLTYKIGDEPQFEKPEMQVTRKLTQDQCLTEVRRAPTGLQVDDNTKIVASFCVEAKEVPPPKPLTLENGGTLIL